MTEPTIICPKCQCEIKLTESLAAPLLEVTRREYEQQIAQKDAEVSRKEADLKAREAAIEKAQATIDDEVAQKLTSERARITAEEGKKIRLAYDLDLKKKANDIDELTRIIKDKDEKLTEAQKLQAELLKKERDLDDAKRELDLTVEKRVGESLAMTKEQGRKEAENQLRLKLTEKDQTIESMRKQLEDAQRKAEQGSQQLQGEALELTLESLLASRFPHDLIEPIAKGQHGADMLQRVHSPLGTLCGSILWETKNAKNWSDGWLTKLRDDQRTAKAEISVIVSQVLPRDVETFSQIDGVWVTHPRTAYPVALVLRQTLIEVAASRQIAVGQQTKTELLYQYLTGTAFRQRVEAIIDAFTAMQDDLDRERKALLKQWAKREKQIEQVIHATSGMWGDLQGIVGKSLTEIEGLSLLALESGEPSAAAVFPATSASDNMHAASVQEVA